MHYFTVRQNEITIIRTVQVFKRKQHIKSVLNIDTTVTLLLWIFSQMGCFQYSSFGEIEKGWGWILVSVAVCRSFRPHFVFSTSFRYGLGDLILNFR